MLSEMNRTLSHLLKSLRDPRRRRNFPTVCLFLLSLLAISESASAAAPPRVLFQDGFETALAGGQPDVPPWTSLSVTDDEHALTVRTDTENLFSRGPENRFLEYRDSSTSASLILGAGQTLSTEVATFSFLFHEPTDAAHRGQLTVQFFAGNGNAIAANRVQVFNFRDGEIRGSANVGYGMDRSRRIDLVLNNSSHPVTYRDGTQTVASGKTDIWIDGELAAADFSHAREVGPGPIRGFDIRTFTNHSQRVYLDNVTVFEGAVVDAPFFRKPDEASFPLILQKDREVEELFGYAPKFSPNTVSFDSFNRPYFRSRTADIDETRHVETFRDGIWEERSFIAALEELYPDFDSV